jgi:hypothetical protein
MKPRAGEPSASGPRSLTWATTKFLSAFLTLPFCVIAQMPQMQGQPPEPPKLPHPEIPPPEELPVHYPWWAYLLGGLVLAGLVTLVIVLIFGRKEKPVTVTKRPLGDALRRMKDLRAKADVLPPSEVGHGVSEILRRYYMDRYHIPAPFKTTEELFPRVPIEEEPIRRRVWRQRFESLAALYDSLAYAPLPATRSEAIALVETAIIKLEEERLQSDE